MRAVLVRLAVVAACVAATLAGSPAPAGAGSSIVAVSCVFTIEAGFSPPLTLSPADSSISLNGTGLCVVNGEVANAGFRSTVYSLVPATCGAGVYTGLSAFWTMSEELPGFSPVSTTMENVGGVFTITLIEGIVFDMVGVFAQTAATQQAGCVTGSQSSTSLAGVFAGQDPVLPV